jgi:flagellar hook assembly protein FlgD
MGIYPSPAFAGEAHVLYRARSAGSVDVAVYDVSGRMVRQLESGYVTAGIHDLKWDGLDEKGTAVSAGIYFVRFVSASGTRVTERLAIVR